MSYELFKQMFWLSHTSRDQLRMEVRSSKMKTSFVKGEVHSRVYAQSRRDWNGLPRSSAKISKVTKEKSLVLLIGVRSSVLCWQLKKFIFICSPVLPHLYCLNYTSSFLLAYVNFSYRQCFKNNGWFTRYNKFYSDNLLNVYAS